MDKIKNWILIILTASTIILGLLYFTKKDTEIIRVPVSIEVPVPGKTKTFPPVEMPLPKKEKPRPITNIPEEDKDSVLQDVLTEREYNLPYKDSTQQINVKTTVLGRLLKQEVGYEIYPDTIQVDTEIDVPVPVRPIILLNLQTGSPQPKVPLELGGTFIPKNKKLGYIGSYDFINKNFKAGVSIKF